MARKSTREMGYKKIDTWKKEKNGELYIFHVYISTDQDDKQLLARCDHDNIPVRVTDSDLGALEDKVDKLVDEASGLKWERKIYVVVKGDKVRDYTFKDGKTLVVQTAYVETGIRQGEPVHRWYKLGMGDDQTIHRGLPRLGSFHTTDLTYRRPCDPMPAPDAMGALIDDTPENRESLEEIFRAMGMLRDRLADLLSPDQIIQSLTKIAAGINNALPAPVVNGTARTGQGHHSLYQS